MRDAPDDSYGQDDQLESDGTLGPSGAEEDVRMEDAEQPMRESSRRGKSIRKATVKSEAESNAGSKAPLIIDSELVPATHVITRFLFILDIRGVLPHAAR